MITPASLAAPGTEHAHQKAFFQWITTKGVKRFPEMIRTFAIPNGAKLEGQGTDKARSEGARMKAEGLRPGVPDTFCPVPMFERLPAIDRYGTESALYRPERNGKVVYHGLWIELKKPGRYSEGTRLDDGLHGRTEEQRDWHKALLAQGYAVVTAYSYTDAAMAIALYFEGKLNMPDEGDCVFAVGVEHEPW